MISQKFPPEASNVSSRSSLRCRFPAIVEFHLWLLTFISQEWRWRSATLTACHLLWSLLEKFQSENFSALWWRPPWTERKIHIGWNPNKILVCKQQTKNLITGTSATLGKVTSAVPAFDWLSECTASTPNTSPLLWVRVQTIAYFSPVQKR